MQKTLCDKVEIQKCLSRKQLCVCDISLSNPLFVNLPRAETHNLNSFAQIKNYSSQQRLFYQGDKINNIYMVLQGSTKLYSEKMGLETNQEYTHRIYYKGDLINPEMILTDESDYAYSAKALENSIVLILNRILLLDFMQKNPVTFYNLAKLLSFELNSTKQESCNLIFQDVSERLLNFINQEVENNQSQEITLSLSKAELAQYLGTIPATLSRAFKKLEAQGCIQRNKNKITCSF